MVVVGGTGGEDALLHGGFGVLEDLNWKELRSEELRKTSGTVRVRRQKWLYRDRGRPISAPGPVCWGGRRLVKMFEKDERVNTQGLVIRTVSVAAAGHDRCTSRHSRAPNRTDKVRPPTALGLHAGASGLWVYTAESSLCFLLCGSNRSLK